MGNDRRMGHVEDSKKKGRRLKERLYCEEGRRVIEWA